MVRKLYSKIEQTHTLNTTRMRLRMNNSGIGKGRAGHRAGGEETDTTGQFRVPRRGSVRRREDGERGTSKSTGRSERVEIC